VVLVALLAPCGLPAQVARPAAPSRPRSSWNAFPLASFQNETGFAFGGFGVHYFRLGGAPAESPPSYVAAAAAYTTRNQILLDLLPEFWWDHERNLFTGQLAYRLFPDRFFGIGNATLAAHEERYLLNAFSDRLEYRRRVAGPLFVGLRQEFQAWRLEDLLPAGMLAAGNLPGAGGGVRSGFGPMVVLDSRDNTLATRRGVYILGSLVSFHPWLGSDYRYTAFTVDARHYHTAGRHTLALQYYLALCDGDVPLTGMPMMGGKTLMRGHYEGRFRDRNFFTVQAEYRLMPLWWRFGVNVFAGLGEVAPRLRDFTFEGLKWSLGAGLRFALNPAERIHLRLDVGVGYDTWGLYVNVLEVF
jgi:hypothetical protein